MAGRVIQGFFVGGRPRIAVPLMQPPPVPGQAVQPKAQPRAPGPPVPAFGGSPVVQAKTISRPPGPPLPAFAARPPVAQARSAGGSFQVDPGRLGLTSGGGNLLPNAVRGPMEAALGADFSAVRVHVGPQAERIGAVAFTMGNDIYFAPGRFQPDTLQGKQLLGHELSHVVQQRQGRVRNPLGAGIAVVQDRALEAEADRLGYRAAAYQGVVQAKPGGGKKKKNKKAQGGAADPDTSGVEVKENKVTFTAGYATWDQLGSRWHVNWSLGEGRVYHVTKETPPRVHYFFRYDGGTIEDAVAPKSMKGLPGSSKKFSALPLAIRAYVSKNYDELLKGAVA
jgi:Domain of unknown function (DUF4157)